jgi:hypothetical protein
LSTVKAGFPQVFHGFMGIFRFSYRFCTGGAARSAENPCPERL